MTRLIQLAPPGRIDARVRGLSSSAGDNTTLLNSLISESGTTGAELWLPEGVYPATGTLQSHARIAGPGTLRKPATTAAQAVLNAAGTALAGVRLRDITLDGGGALSGLTFSPYPATATDTRITGVTFTNTGTADQYNRGITIAWVDGLDLLDCTFTGCNFPIAVYDFQRVRLVGNRTDSSAQNGIQCVLDQANWVAAGLIIAGNTIRGCQRIGIETYSSQGSSVYDAPLITGNRVEIADSYTTGYGYSIPSAPGARVTDNAAWYSGTGTLPTYGYELVGGDGHAVAGNHAANFATGMAANSTMRPRITGNNLAGCQRGIDVFNTTADTFQHTITANVITEARDFGIHIDANNGTYPHSGGLLIDGNTIIRATAWSGDATRSYGAISVATQQLPTQITRNRIVQGQAAPTAGFVFVGIYAFVSAGGLTASKIHDNLFWDQKTGGAMMLPLANNGGAAAVADVDLAGNILTNVTYTTSNVTSWS